MNSARRAAPHGKVLILGGTGEALALVRTLAQHAGLQTVLSLAGRTSTPRLPDPDACEVRQGGFDGATGLARYLQEHGIDFVADATHPFATQISNNARAACDATGVARAMLGRHPWRAHQDDRWTTVASTTEAVRNLDQRKKPSHVLVTVGSRDAALFLELHQHQITMRMIEEPPALAAARAAHPHNDLILERGPFHIEDEQQLFRARAINIVVAKNAGGDAAQSKVIAARVMRREMLIVQAPPPPLGTMFYETDELARHIADELQRTQ